MGRLEKIVVLTVLFLVAVILGVSLNQGADPVEAAPEETLAQATEEPADDPLPPAGAQSPRTGQEGPAGALSTLVGTEQQTPVPSATPEEVPAQPDPTPPRVEPAPTPTPDPAVSSPQPSGSKAGELLTSEGLTQALVPDLMIYTWAEGDSFQGLAERYFGSRLEVGRLRKANEGRDEARLRVGDRIFVPSRAPERVERLTPAESVAGQWSGGVYRVESGDMLGKIAQKVYGSAAKWRVIYDANRDVLSSPDDLQIGMALRIPRVD